MTAFSNYVENRLLDHLLGPTSFTKPSSLYLALFLSPPTDDTPGIEVSGNGYTRVLITFGNAISGQSSSSSSAVFTAGSNGFGTITHIGIYDSLVNGSLLCSGMLQTPQIVGSNEVLTFPVGGVVVTLD